jgi:thymidine kinase
MSSKLELIIGPMFSGKSTELIKRIRLLKIINKKVIVIKPLIDNRYISNKITSHDFDSADCYVLSCLSEINNDTLKEYDTIIIDEGQFFNDLKSTILFWIDNFNVNIIIAGLDGDFQRNPIGQILELIPYSDKCKKLNSFCNMCKDGTQAPFTFRINKSINKVLVGGAESYMPLCRNHYNNLYLKSTNNE